MPPKKLEPGPALARFHRGHAPASILNEMGSAPVKVAFIRYRYDQYGGAEMFTQRLIEFLSRSGIEVHLFARSWEGEAKEFQVHRIPVPSWPPVIANLCFVIGVDRALRKSKFSLVQSNERTLHQDVYRAGDGVHARFLELRTRHMNRLRRWSITLNPSHHFRLWLERRMFQDRSLKAVVVNSEMVRHEIRSRFNVPDEIIHTIYNGVDLERFRPENRQAEGSRLRQELGLPEHLTTILFVGSGFERKGLSFLMRGMALAGGNSLLLVVGKGRTSNYEKLALELGIKNRMLFVGPQKNVQPYYAAADLFALPTIYDPFPTAVLEALASGLPVITTKQCGAAEIIDEGKEGFVLKFPEDLEGLANGLRALCAPEVRSSMGKAARLLAEKFPIEKTMAEFWALYVQLLSQSVSEI